MAKPRGTAGLKKERGGYPLSRQDRLNVERGVYIKKWKDKYPVALIYPNTYAVGMSNLGFQLVYSFVNERDDAVCERFFLPEKNEPFISMESGRPLGDFSLVLFSISFEYDFLNLVKILLLGAIEPFTDKRNASSVRSPFIICGGVAMFMNPEPVAPYADFILIGEAEPVLGDFLDFLQVDAKNMSLPSLYIEAAKKFEGIYVPSLYTPELDTNGKYVAMNSVPGVPSRIKRVKLCQCDEVGHSELLSPAAEFSNLYLAELGRGCSQGCRFCAAGFIYRPPRLWNADAVIQGLSARSEGVLRVGLLGMEMAHDDVVDAVSSYLTRSGCALSFSSLRADKINDKLLHLLGRSGLRSVAIAPDGTSRRLRAVINKGLDEADLLRAAKKLVGAGIVKLKLYVMVGLPTETSEDLQEMVDLIGMIKSEIDPIGKKRGRLTEILVSVNCFIAKPWTPFQYHPFGISTKLEKDETYPVSKALLELRDRIAYLKKGVQQFANVHLQADKPENAMLQALLAKGDRRIAKVLFDMAAFNISWKKSMKNHGLVAEHYIMCGGSAQSYFPWHIIDHGINDGYLWREYLRGIEAKPTAPCDPSICRRCGVCGEI